MKIRAILWILFLSSIIVLVLDILTNSIDPQKNAWDFLYYIALAKDGFNAEPMASPFAYRYLTPFLVHGLSFLGMTIEHGFGLIAYFGAIVQLTGIFFFVEWFTKSRKSAYLAMGITALSLFNVKFLLFDVYRPDHLAYGLILLQTYFAFKRKFLPLLIVTVIASQIREFNIIPLAAYLFMRWRAEDRISLVKETILSAILLLPAIVLPRILIPVTENYQIVGLSQSGIVTALILPFIPSVDFNFLFVVAAYFLPLLFIADLTMIKTAYISLPKDQQRYLSAYTILVLLLTFMGGTDFFRFATFLFLPQIILIGLIVSQKTTIPIGFMFAAVFIFNRIWLPFPTWDRDQYLDFYGGFSLRLNWAILYRALEYLAFIALGFLLRKRFKEPSRAHNS